MIGMHYETETIYNTFCCFIYSDESLLYKPFMNAASAYETATPVTIYFDLEIW